MLGPDIGDGSFKPTAIKSIHYKRLPVQRVWTLCFLLSLCDRNVFLHSTQVFLCTLIATWYEQLTTGKAFCMHVKFSLRIMVT